VTYVERFLGYFAVLRPSFVFGALIAGLPLTTIPGVPGATLIGNLFVDYAFSEAFWLGMALLGAAWALMLTAGLSLDAERDRQDARVYDPERVTPRRQRWVTVPVPRVEVVVAFTLLGLPGAAAVVLHAAAPAYAAAGVVLGAVLMYAAVDAAIALLRLGDAELHVLPWRSLTPRVLGRLVGATARRVLGAGVRGAAIALARIASVARAPDHFFAQRNPPRLKSDLVFAAWMAILVLAVYLLLYRTLRPGGLFYARLDALPPAGFLYVLLTFLLFVVSLLWTLLRRYRLTLYVFALWVVAMSWVQSAGPVEGDWWRGHPLHTYDVHRLPGCDELAASEVLAPLADASPAGGGGHTLIVAAASGGGILAAGWTAKVLGELHRAYPRFRRELRLISAVSGGSVGTVHYVRAHDSRSEPLGRDILRRVFRDSVDTSLAAAAYGFAFPDLHRMLIPIGVPQFDRGRLQEARWRATADGASGAEANPELLSHWSDAIRRGSKPAVILNATVLESGERVAITQLRSLQQVEPTEPPADWSGWRPPDSAGPAPRRRNGARTLSEFLLPEDRARAPGYTVDVWTAARLSATFSYVSPPARARLRCGPGDADCAHEELSRYFARLHLIDGGYHENFGVASALDWLTRAVRLCAAAEACPFARVALIEIRAKPVVRIEDPDPEWYAAWLGPAAGLTNSWASAQTAANDTSVDRLERVLRASPIRFESFVFEPDSRPRGTATSGGPRAEGSPAGARPSPRPCAAAPGDPPAKPPGGAACCKRSCCTANAALGEEDPPLSWHLSERQKDAIHEYWRNARNQCTLRAFLRFVHCGDATAPCPAAERSVPDPCRQPFDALGPDPPSLASRGP
jgi:hypothetical protein